MGEVFGADFSRLDAGQFNGSIFSFVDQKNTDLSNRLLMIENLPAGRSKPQEFEVNKRAMQLVVAENQAGAIAAANEKPSFYRQAGGVVAGVASTFATKWAISQGLAAAEKYIPTTPVTRAVIGIGSGLLVGGIVNNAVTGRDLLTPTGFASNAGFSAGAYITYELIAGSLAAPRAGSTAGERSLALDSTEFSRTAEDHGGKLLSDLPARDYAGASFKFVPQRSLAAQIAENNGASLEFSNGLKQAEIAANAQGHISLRLPASLTAEQYADIHSATAYTKMLFDDPGMSKAAAEALTHQSSPLATLARKSVEAIEIRPGAFGVSVDLKKPFEGVIDRALNDSANDTVQVAFKGAQAYVSGNTALYNDYSRALLSRFGPYDSESRFMVSKMLARSGDLMSVWNRNFDPSSLISHGIDLPLSKPPSFLPDRRKAIFEALSRTMTEQAGKNVLTSGAGILLH